MNPHPAGFLDHTEIIDWDAPTVAGLASHLADAGGDPTTTAGRCFEWVRDNIKHSSDFQLNPVTCSASQVLAHGTGFCYAKSHLLCALLRANRIPAGLCYQRLSVDGNGPPFCLHGLNAVWLDPMGWYRVDARGNREDVDARFTPPVEKLAFSVAIPGEGNLSEIRESPLPVVVDALRRHTTWDTLVANLPDIAWADDQRH